jgi:hypothetical protein
MSNGEFIRERIFVQVQLSAMYRIAQERRRKGPYLLRSKVEYDGGLTVHRALLSAPRLAL